MNCSSLNGTATGWAYNSAYGNSFNGSWGDWTPYTDYRQMEFMTSARLRIESYLKNGDNTAVNQLEGNFTQYGQGNEGDNCPAQNRSAATNGSSQNPSAVTNGTAPTNSLSAGIMHMMNWVKESYW